MSAESSPLQSNQQVMKTQTKTEYIAVNAIWSINWSISTIIQLGNTQGHPCDLISKRNLFHLLLLTVFICSLPLSLR